MIDQGFTLDDLTVERNHIARAHNDAVARLNVADWHEHLGAVRLEPDLIDIEGHGAREVGNRLFVRPLLEDLAEAQHEHDGACRIEIAAHKRNGDSSGIKHSNGEMTVQQRLNALFDVLCGADDGKHHANGRREEHFSHGAAQHREDELVFKLAVQCAGGVIRHKLHAFGFCERECRERTNKGCAVVLIDDDGVLCAVVDLNFLYAVHGAQVIL